MRHERRGNASMIFFYSRVPLVLLTLCFLLCVGNKSVHAQVVCNLEVPPSPLSPTGLATPWVLDSPCSQAQAPVFVQGVMYNLSTHKLSTYSPLVITQGTTPAVVPTVPKIPKNSMVAIFGGGNDDATTLVGAGASSCVNGADGHVFGQVFFCGASMFWASIHRYGIGVPQLGTTLTGGPCPSVRSFKIVDQDPSDNVQTTYLLLGNGQTAQNTFNNRNNLSGYTIIHNPSDNLVLTNYVDPALHCNPWMVPDLADNGNLLPTQAADELQASVYQQVPIALVPAGDPMVGPNDLNELNAYRTGVDQPVVQKLSQASTLDYCFHLKNVQPSFLSRHKALFQTQPSPAPGVNLYDFLEGRFTASLQILGCP